MFGIGSTELAIILVFGFLLFGPDKLPQMGRTIGRALRQFRETQEKLTAVVQTEVVDPMAAAAQSSAKKAGVVADDDDDADAPGSEKAAAEPARKETFAERRARLAAEKAAAEATKAAEGAPAESAAADGDAPVDAPVADVPAEAETQEAPVEEKPVIRTTEDLYLRGTARNSRRRRVVEAALAEAPAAEAAAGAEAPAPGVEAVADAEALVPADTDAVTPAPDAVPAETDDVAAEGGER